VELVLGNRRWASGRLDMNFRQADDGSAPLAEVLQELVEHVLSLVLGG
jgi:hypothetical protein